MMKLRTAAYKACFLFSVLLLSACTVYVEAARNAETIRLLETPLELENVLPPPRLPKQPETTDTTINTAPLPDDSDLSAETTTPTKGEKPATQPPNDLRRFYCPADRQSGERLDSFATVAVIYLQPSPERFVAAYKLLLDEKRNDCAYRDEVNQADLLWLADYSANSLCYQAVWDDDVRLGQCQHDDNLRLFDVPFDFRYFYCPDDVSSTSQLTLQFGRAASNYLEAAARDEQAAELAEIEVSRVATECELEQDALPLTFADLEWLADYHQHWDCYHHIWGERGEELADVCGYVPTTTRLIEPLPAT